MPTDLTPAGAGPQLPLFATAHEQRNIAAPVGCVMEK